MPNSQRHGASLPGSALTTAAIPVLAAETPDGVHWNMATWIQLGALDMTRTSWFFKGGITGAMKVAHLSDSFGMRCQVHGMGLPNAQICAAIRINDYYEQIVICEEQIDGLADLGPLAIREGWLDVSDAPGLGEDFDWERVERTALAQI
jgi:L-alanine-DL-glutamate epimerase-like enolase superfamily enzyme